MKKIKLTVTKLIQEARTFVHSNSGMAFPEIYGVTDGKTVGTFVEHKFKGLLAERYDFEHGNSTSGIDFPDVNVDVKVTSEKQPQSSCPYDSAKQKIYGLGYSLLVFVYNKTDDHKNKTGCLDFVHTVFIEKEYTADFQTTKGLIQILENNANVDDIIAFMIERSLPLSDIEATKIAENLLQNKPQQGYLTISNALQWRLQYNRIISIAGDIEGIYNLLNKNHDEKQ